MNTGKLNLDDYFKALEKKVQTDKMFEEIYEEYKNFMKKTVWENSILNKNFYIVISETTNIDIQIKICEDRLASLHLRSFRNGVLHLLATFLSQFIWALVFGTIATYPHPPNSH